MADYASAYLGGRALRNQENAQFQEQANNIISKLFPEKKPFDLESSAYEGMMARQLGQPTTPEQEAAMTIFAAGERARINPMTGEPAGYSALDYLGGGPKPQMPQGGGGQALFEAAKLFPEANRDVLSPQPAPQPLAPRSSNPYANTMGGQKMAYEKELSAIEAGNKKAAELSTEKEFNAPKAESALRSAYDQSKLIDQAIGDALGQTGFFSAGYIGEKTKGIGGTPAADLESTLNTIQADAAFDRLQEMRDNSKTGGALGAINKEELDLLKSAKAALLQKQSPAQLKKNLEKYRTVRKETFDRFRSAFEKDYGHVPEFIKSESSQFPPEYEGKKARNKTTGEIGIIKNGQWVKQ